MDVKHKGINRAMIKEYGGKRVKYTRENSGTKYKKYAII
jgi:hypothetical protein